MSNTQDEKAKMYTAQELVWATQLAYCNFTDEMISEYCKEHNNNYPTIQDLLKQEGYGIFYNFNPSADPTGISKIMRDKTMAFIDDVIAGNICQGWKVFSILNNQNAEGTYAINVGIPWFKQQE